jgi:hypothetical protein
VQACAIRVSRLESNGVPSPGADSLYVSDALTQLQVTPVISEGDEFEIKNACGEVCVNFKDCDRLKRLDLTLGFCYPDPELLELVAGGSLLTSGDAVGYAYPELGATSCPNGVSIELWARRIGTDGSSDADFPWEWYVLPRTYWQHSTRTFENGPITVELTGFATENENWFDGPLNDWPVGSDRVLQSIPSASIPDPACGYAELVAS